MTDRMTTADEVSQHELTPDERASWERDGFVVRRGVFTHDELDELRQAGEEVVQQLVEIRRGTRQTAGSYTFEIEATASTVIKWEGDTDVVHGVEPVAHLHPAFRRYAEDQRFTESAASALGTDGVSLFTEKLNLKRARDGRPVILHQDHPYWVGSVENLDCIMTTMLLLDDSSDENGCLQVAPGSHRHGVMPRKTIDGFGSHEMDPEQFDLDSLVPVELAAGDMVMFGPLLVHYSAPNRSDRDRRAILYSYQEPGRRHTLDTMRKLMEDPARPRW